MHQPAVYRADTIHSGLGSTLSTHRVLRNTYALLSMTLLFSALTEQVGRPVNEYIAGNVDEWLAAMQWALDWDAANDNGVTSKIAGNSPADLPTVQRG